MNPSPAASALNFQNSVLLISARSPFARRVRIAFLESGLAYQEKVFDVFKPTPELFEINPLGRVPALVLSSGKTLIDSNLILQLFYESRESPLWPKRAEDRLECSRWTALATGLCEKIVEAFIETLRPEAHRDSELLAEARTAAERVLILVDAALSGRETLVSCGLTQADLDVGTMLAYYSLRMNEAWPARFPHAARYLARLNERDSFKKTQPPRA